MEQEIRKILRCPICEKGRIADAPSAEVIRLSNAINRGLDQPDSPEAVMALILQGARSAPHFILMEIQLSYFQFFEFVTKYQPLNLAVPLSH